MSELPVGWAQARLGMLGRYINGRGFKASEWSELGFPIIRIQNLTGSSSTVNHYSGEIEDRYIVEPGDLLISWAATLGAYFWPGPRAVLNQHIFRVESYINKTFHKYLVDHVLNELMSKTHGSGMVHITRKPFDETPVLLPPLAEQERIVAAIEEQYSRLDSGVASLEQASRKLKSLRAAVLRAAVAGRLTEAKTRAAANGFPAEWKMCSPEDIAASKRNALAIGPFGSNLKVSDYASQGIPLVFVRQVRSGVFGGTDTRYISEEKAEELKAHSITAGDVLVTKMGEPPGDATVYPAGQPDAVITADVIKVSVREGILPEYVSMAMNSKWVRDQVITITSGVAQQKVSLARFRQSILIPIPPAEEQARIVERVGEWMQEIDRADTSIRTQLARASSLRSSVLATAFSGKLVPQDPDEEPALVLLERITAEHAAPNGYKSGRGRKARVVREEVTA